MMTTGRTFLGHIVMKLVVEQQAAAALSTAGASQSVSCGWVAGEPQQHMAAHEENCRRKTTSLVKEIQPFSVLPNLAKFWTDPCEQHFFFFKQFRTKVPGQ